MFQWHDQKKLKVRHHFFTPDSGHAYHMSHQAVCENLSVKGFKGLEISTLLFRHNRGQVSL